MGDRDALRAALRSKIRSQRNSRCAPPADPAQLLKDPTTALLQMGVDDPATLARAPELLSAAKALGARAAHSSANGLVPPLPPEPLPHLPPPPAGAGEDEECPPDESDEEAPPPH